MTSCRRCCASDKLSCVSRRVSRRRSLSSSMFTISCSKWESESEPLLWDPRWLIGVSSFIVGITSHIISLKRTQIKEQLFSTENIWGYFIRGINSVTWTQLADYCIVPTLKLVHNVNQMVNREGLNTVTNCTEQGLWMHFLKLKKTNWKEMEGFRIF